MRLLAVLPGASYSTLDVATGIIPELRKLGVDVIEYDLGARLELSGRWLTMVWRSRGKPDPKFNRADVVYGAAKDAIERALWWNVDGVLIFSGMFFPKAAAILFRRAGIRTAALLSESPYDTDKEMNWVDAVDVAWTNERAAVKRLREANPNVNYMPHAFNPEIHYPRGGDPHRSGLANQTTGQSLTGADEDDVPAYDVVFVGSLFAERVDLLSRVDWTGINFGLYGEWSGLPGRHKLRRHLAGDVVDNRYTAALYRKAKIGLNLYRESMGWGKDAPRLPAGSAQSMNPRTLELAACGTFQISQSRAELEEVFEGWIPTFKTAAELDQLIHWYLDPTVERPTAAKRRRDYAQEALERVQPHTFAARARTIIDDLARAEWPVKVVQDRTPVAV